MKMDKWLWAIPRLGLVLDVSDGYFLWVSVQKFCINNFGLCLYNPLSDGN